MTQMTNSAARGGQDPFLTRIARGYQQNDLIGSVLFPKVPVNVRGGRITTFGKEAFFLYGNLERAPGEDIKQTDFGFAGAPFVLRDYALAGRLPVETQEEAENGPVSIDLAEIHINGTQQIIATRLEVAQALLATNAANYPSSNKVTLTGAAQWSDPGSDPIGDIETAKEAIRAATGKMPNVLEIGAAVYAKLKLNPKITGRLQYTSTAVANETILAGLFDVERVVVGRSVYATDAGVLTDAWGKSVVLAYTATASVAARGAPSFGYTYQLEGYPRVMTPWFNESKNSWMYPVLDACAPVIAGADSGYLISNAVA